jgi:small subunit ribosomal protein S6
MLSKEKDEKLKDYEAVLIFPVSPSPDKQQICMDKVLDVIRKNGGHILKETRWGKRTPAYRIRKQREGYYLVLEFSVDPSKIQALTERFRLMEEELLRVLILQKKKAAALAKPKPQEAVQTA